MRNENEIMAELRRAAEAKEPSERRSIARGFLRVIKKTRRLDKQIERLERRGVHVGSIKLH